MRTTLVLCLLAFVVSAGAAERTVLFRGATIHPVSAPILEKGDLLVQGGRIKEVGTGLVADGAEVVDVSGKHIYPGLIAANTTAGLVEIDAARPTRDFAEVGKYTPDVRSWVAVNPDSELLPVARANGITHISPSPSGGIVPGYSGVVALHGWTVEEMAIKTPSVLHLYWPSMNLDLTPRDQLRDKSRFKSFEEQAKERAARVRDLDDFFAEAEAYGRAKKAGKTKLVPQWEAMTPFLEGIISLMVHADEQRQIEAAVEWAAGKKYRISIAGGRDAWMLADLLAKHQVPVLFERVYYMGSSSAATPARDVDPYDVHFRAPAVLHEAGVKLALGVGLGGHSFSEVRNLPYIAAQAIAFGLPEEAALKSITLHPAEILGVADRLGSLQAGKDATLVVASGDLFDIRTQVEQVWIAGEKTSLDTRHTRLRDKYQNRPRK